MVKIKYSGLVFLLTIVSTIVHSQVILDSIVIKADKRVPGTAIFTPDRSKIIIPITGENDPLKYIYQLPGVSSGVEGSSALFVRGGNSGNNRIELDGVPFYDAGHLLGLISSFPSGIIETITFRKGGHSSSSGDYSASVTEIKSKSYPDGHSMSLSPFFIGGISSGYISKPNNFSYLASVRYSPSSLVWRAVKNITSIENVDLKPSSGDLFFKLNTCFLKKHNITAGVFYGDDKISFTQNEVNMDMKWRNKAIFGNWTYRPMNWLSIDWKNYYLQYSNSQRQNTVNDLREFELLKMREYIKEFSSIFKIKIDYRNFYLLAGAEFKRRNINVENMWFSNNLTENMPAYFSDINYETDKINIMAGIRHNIYTKGMTDYHFNFMFFPNDRYGFEITYDKMHQSTHIAEGAPAGWKEFIVPASDSLPSEMSRQYYAGGFYSGKRTKLTLGVFYKKQNNVTSFRRPSDMFLTDLSQWNKILSLGEGSSRGIESSFNYLSRRISVNINYTLSKSDRHYSDLNRGNPFPFQYDRRHILSVLSIYTIRETSKLRQFANINISYTSGGNSTIPVASYGASELPFIGYLENDGFITDLTEYYLQYTLLNPTVNGFKMPDYCRVDVGYNLLWKRDKYKTELNIGIANLFNRRNASMIFYHKGNWKQLAIIPFTPHIGLNVSF